jgi:CheY-like chemotaxis protein
MLCRQLKDHFLEVIEVRKSKRPLNDHPTHPLRLL